VEKLGLHSSPWRESWLLPGCLSSDLGYEQDWYSIWFCHKLVPRNTVSVCLSHSLRRLKKVDYESRKYFPKKGPEARLYLACFAGVLLPTGMFIYAWSSFPFVPWIALTIGIVVRRLSFMSLAAVHLDVLGFHLGDIHHLPRCVHVPGRLVRHFPSRELRRVQAVYSYGPFASSALAGQSLLRKSATQVQTTCVAHASRLGNLMATAFPLFTQQMFAALSYKWASTLFGCVAAMMIPIPIVRSSPVTAMAPPTDRVR